MDSNRRGWFLMWGRNRQPWEWTGFAELNDYILAGLPVQTDDNGNAVRIPEIG